MIARAEREFYGSGLPMAAREVSDLSRDRRVAATVAGIEKKFGVGAVQRLGAVAKPGADVVPTGVTSLDCILGIGGWPRGRICEVFGPESVGVTTLLLQSLASAQQRGGIVALVDVDHAFVPEYARASGCRVEEIFVAQPYDGPMALEIVDALVRSGAFDVIALDSVPGLYSSRSDDQPGDSAGEALARARLLRRGNAPPGRQHRSDGHSRPVRQPSGRPARGRP
jgi:recombination protein RecA